MTFEDIAGPVLTGFLLWVILCYRELASTRRWKRREQAIRRELEESRERGNESAGNTR